MAPINIANFIPHLDIITLCGCELIYALTNYIVTEIMFAKSVLVTGCNRGIGLELIKHLAGKTQHLFATCRIPDEAEVSL